MSEPVAAAKKQATLGPYGPHPHHPANPHARVRESYTSQDRIALRMTRAIGTMWAVYAFATIMAGWMVMQVVLGNGAFDPYPFAFLLFLGNIAQLLLMPLIMVGQNLQGRHAEARAEEEFRTTQKTFADTETMLAHLDAQDAELLRQTTLLRALVERLLPPDEVARIEGSDPAGSPRSLDAGPVGGGPGPGLATFRDR